MTSTMDEYLTQIEKDLTEVSKTAAQLAALAKKAKTAATVGELRKLAKSLDDLGPLESELRQRVANLESDRSFDETAFMASDAYLKEIIDDAAKIQVRIYEQDGRLYCYPSLVSVQASDRTLKIDRDVVRNVRPSTVADELRRRQTRPARLKPEAYIEVLLKAYALAVRTRGEKKPGKGTVVPLIEIYGYLTLLPGVSKDYGLQEFARDVYLLDASKLTTTKDDLIMSLPASTGTRSRSTLSMITKEGKQKPYYGIKFTSPMGGHE